MNKVLTVPERLIVAADFKPEWLVGMTINRGRDEVREKVLSLARSLQGTGVYIKVNSILRAIGYDLIGEIQSLGLKVFADLKLSDIPETLSIDGILLAECKPGLLTVMCSTSVASIKALKAVLPDTELLGVTIITSMIKEDVNFIYRCDISEAAVRLASQAALAGADGFICAATEIGEIKKQVYFNLKPEGFTFNCPNIRPGFIKVKGDDQNKARQATPAEAIKLGATRIVLGRPITQAKDPGDAVKRILDEISEAVI